MRKPRHEKCVYPDFPTFIDARRPLGNSVWSLRPGTSFFFCILMQIRPCFMCVCVCEWGSEYQIWTHRLIKVALLSYFSNFSKEKTSKWWNNTHGNFIVFTSNDLLIDFLSSRLPLPGYFTHFLSSNFMIWLYVFSLYIRTNECLLAFNKHLNKKKKCFFKIETPVRLSSDVVIWLSRYLAQMKSKPYNTQPGMKYCFNN